MVFEAGKISNENEAFETAMQELEETFRLNRHLKPSPRLIIQQGRVLTNRGNIKEGIGFYDKAIALAIKQQNTSMQALALRMKAANQHTMDELGAAELNLKKSIELSYTNKQMYQVAASLHTLSLVYLAAADFDKYLETSEESLRILKASGADGIVYARAYINTMVARCVELMNVKMYERVEPILNELISSAELTQAGEYGYINAMLTQGQYLTETGEYKKSNDVLLLLLNKIKDIPVNEEVAAIHGYLAENMAALKKYKEAEGHIKITVDYYRKDDKFFLLATSLLSQAAILVQCNKIKGANTCCKEAEKLMANATSDFYLWQFNKKYAGYHEQQKDYRKAYTHIVIAQKHQSASMRTDYDKRINGITHRYELMEKEKENQLLKKDIDMKRQELSMASDFLNQKVELLKELKSFMKDMRRDNIRKNEMIKAMDGKINDVLNVKYEQQLIMDKIEISANDFIVKLRSKYPVLSLTEAKVCSLVHNNFSNKEIANLLVTSIRTIENHRYNIRKKLPINGDDTLQTWLMGVK